MLRDDSSFFDTGIPWAGYLPKNWQLKRIKHTGGFKTGKDYKNLEEGDIPLFGSSSKPFEYVNQFLSNKKAIASHH